MTIHICIFANGYTDEETEFEINCKDRELLDEMIEAEMEKREIFSKNRGWYLVSAHPKKGRGGKRANTGGKRAGSGRPKGSGKWGDKETTIARIPKTAAAKIEQLIDSEETLEGILQAWKQQCKTAKAESITGNTPRTYDKIIQLIRELEEEIGKMNHIV